MDEKHSEIKEINTKKNENAHLKNDSHTVDKHDNFHAQTTERL